MHAGCACPPRSTVLRRRVHCAAAVLLLLSVVAGCGDDGGSSPEQRMAVQVERLRADPRRLADLLRQMPKGADLHSHLTGAAQTESLIAWGIEDELCVDDASVVSSNP